MNIMTRLAIIEQILEDGASEPTDRLTGAPIQRRIGDGRRRLIDDLDQAQMLKAVAYIRPGRDTTT
jgi:hypothetical protein